MAVMKLRLMVLVALVILGLVHVGVEAQICVTTNTTGCLNGVSYDYKTQFPCRDHVYDWASQGCCAEGFESNRLNHFVDW